MLGNVPELWVSMLAAMKLGVVLIPASTLLTPDDLADRLARGNVAVIVVRRRASATASPACRSPASGSRSATRPTAGTPTPPSTPARRRSRPTAPPRPPIRCSSTSPAARRELPKLVEHTHASYPAGHLSTMYWLGLQPGDVHLNISSPGWAKHAWSCVFAPWNAEAAVFQFNQPRFDAPALLDAIVAHRVTSLCAPPTVWRLLIQQDLASYPRRAARADRRRRAAQPRGDRAGRAGLGHHHPRRLRADRDDAPGRQLRRPAGPHRLDGPPARPATRSSSSTSTARGLRARRGRGLHRPRPPSARADDRLPRRRRRRRPRRCATASTTPATSPCATRTAT